MDFSQQCFGDISAAQQQREVREIPSPRTGENGFAEHPWPLLPGDKRNEQGLVPRSSGASSPSAQPHEQPSPAGRVLRSPKPRSQGCSPIPAHPCSPQSFITSPCSSSLLCPNTSPHLRKPGEIDPEPGWDGQSPPERSQSQTGILPALGLHTKSPKILSGPSTKTPKILGDPSTKSPKFLPGDAGAAPASPALVLGSQRHQECPSSLMLLNYSPCSLPEAEINIFPCVGR